MSEISPLARNIAAKKEVRLASGGEAADLIIKETLADFFQPQRHKGTKIDVKSFHEIPFFVS